MPPPEKPQPQPKLPKPKPEKHKAGPAAANARPAPSQRDEVPTNGGVPVLPRPFSATSCATFPLCPPPPSPPATVHLRSGRLPTPLIAVSASLLALSAVLLLALLVRWLVRRHRLGQQQEQHAVQDQEAPLAPDDDDESVLGVDTTAWAGHGAEGDEEVDSGDVHHVWFIRTKGLDERAIAAIAAVVYDASSKGKSRNGGEDGGDGCAVCLAEFRDGETLRLLPRCGHAFHRVCIDTWLRAHVNCPLCRAPVQVHVTDKASATAAWVHSQPTEEATLAGAARAEDEAERVVAAERAVRRAASMVTIPRRPWPDVQAPPAPASSSSSAREEDMTGLAKIRRLLKLSDAFAGVGRSASFGAACQRLATTRSSDLSAAASTGGVSGGDEIELSR